MAAGHSWKGGRCSEVVLVLKLLGRDLSGRCWQVVVIRRLSLSQVRIYFFNVVLLLPDPSLYSQFLFQKQFFSPLSWNIIFKIKIFWRIINKRCVPPLCYLLSKWLIFYYATLQYFELQTFTLKQVCFAKKFSFYVIVLIIIYYLITIYSYLITI